MAQDLRQPDIKHLADFAEFAEKLPVAKDIFSSTSNFDAQFPKWKVSRTMEETNNRPGNIWVHGSSVEDAILSAKIADFRVFRAALGDEKAVEIINKTKYEIAK